MLPVTPASVELLPILAVTVGLTLAVVSTPPAETAPPVPATALAAPKLLSVA